jgi:hypothetical protein
MPTVEIQEVAIVPTCPPELLGGALESPTPGTTSEAHGIEVKGFVVSRTAPIVAVDFIHEGLTAGRATLDYERPDVVKGAPEGFKSGFQAMVGLVGSAPRFDLRIEVVLSTGQRIALGEIRGTRQPLKSSYKPKVQPLLVSCIGRSGTTWLMRLLSGHPAIVTHHLYPHEVRPAQYWMHMLKVLSSPANHTQSGHAWHFHENQFFVGTPPDYWTPVVHDDGLKHWFGRTYTEDLAAFVQRSIDGFYRATAKSQKEPMPAYFAEKHYPVMGTLTGATASEYLSLTIARMFREIYDGARELLLMRDFRDRLCSISSFNAQNRAVEFGRQHVTTDEEFVWRLRSEAQMFVQYWKQNNEAHLVRYEDLILQPEESLTHVLDYVGLDSSPKVVKLILDRASEDTPELQRHRTSGDPKNSVGRWRRDINPVLLPVAQEALSDVMQEFGYAA